MPPQAKGQELPEAAKRGPPAEVSKGAWSCYHLDLGHLSSTTVTVHFEPPVCGAGQWQPWEATPVGP